MKPKAVKPVSKRKFYGNIKALSPKKRSKIMAFLPILEEIRAPIGAKF